MRLLSLSLCEGVRLVEEVGVRTEEDSGSEVWLGGYLGVAGPHSVCGESLELLQVGSEVLWGGELGSNCEIETLYSAASV